MSPRQTAADLIAKFHPYCGGTEPMQTENAKKCALIEADICIHKWDVACDYLGMNLQSRIAMDTEFWEEVKKEIQKYEP